MPEAVIFYAYISILTAITAGLLLPQPDANEH